MCIPSSLISKSYLYFYSAMYHTLVVLMYCVSVHECTVQPNTINGTQPPLCGIWRKMTKILPSSAQAQAQLEAVLAFHFTCNMGLSRCDSTILTACNNAGSPNKNTIPTPPPLKWRKQWPKQLVAVGDLKIQSRRCLCFAMMLNNLQYSGFLLPTYRYKDQIDLTEIYLI